MDANGSAKPIDLEGVNFDELLAESNLQVGPPGLDAEIVFYGDARVKIKPFTQLPRYVEVETTYPDYTGNSVLGIIAKDDVLFTGDMPDRARALRNFVVRPRGTLSSSSSAGRASRVTSGLRPSQNDRTSRPPRAGGDHATRRTRCTMMRSKTRWTLAGFMALVVVGVAWATPGSGVTTTILTGPVMLDELDLKSNTDTHKVMIKTWGASDVYVVQNRIVPGGHTGWHSHPGISFVTVKSGTATEYHGDDPSTPNTYPAGTGFVEEAGGVHIIRNEGTADLELVAFQLLPYGAVRRIDEPAP